MAAVKRLLPSLNRVLVEKFVPPSKTTAGILLPAKTAKLNSGKVVAVGPGACDRNGNLIPVSFKEGDHVLLPEYGGTEVKLNDKELQKQVQYVTRGNLHILRCSTHLEGTVASYVSLNIITDDYLACLGN